MRATPEQVRERAARVAESLERRWRLSAGRLRDDHRRDSLDILRLRLVQKVPPSVERDACAIEAAADGLRAVAAVIRGIDLGRED